MDSVNTWLSNVGKELDVDATLEDGFCSLIIDDDLTVAIECHEGDEHLYLSAEIGQLPQEGDVEQGFTILQRAMELNAYQEATDGGAIGLAVGEPVMVYSKRIALASADARSLSEDFANFYAAALYLRESLELAPVPHETED